MTSKPTDAQRLAVQPPDPSRHDEMLDLIAKTFSNWHGYWPFLNYCRGGYLDKSHYDPKVSRIGLLDGRIVTNWTVYDYQMRIGRCSVRVGGVGVVSTHGEFRKRGLMVPTGMGSIQAMRDSGYDLTLLFGLHNFYHHFSYVRAFTEQSYTIAAAELLPPARRRAAEIRSAAKRPGVALQPRLAGPDRHGGASDLPAGPADDWQQPSADRILLDRQDRSAGRLRRHRKGSEPP